MKKCLLAFEPEVVEELKERIATMSRFKDWQFETCSNAQELTQYTYNYYDVVVLSRNFPGEKADTLLSNIQLLFPTSRIVIFAWEQSEKRRAYIKLVKDMGFNNIVTGNPPGDRPYTLPVALEYDYAKIVGVTETDVTETKEDKGYSENQHPSTIQESLNTIKTREVENESLQETIVNEVPLRRFQIKRKPPLNNNLNNEMVSIHSEVVTSRLDEKIEPVEDKYTEESSLLQQQNIEELLAQSGNYKFEKMAYSSQITGKVIVPSANKGGVGKTTVAINPSVLLASADIKTCLLDLDFGGENIAAFFKVENVPGIEALANKPLYPTLIDDLLVEVRSNLFILPGTMSKTIPHFEIGTLKEIIGYLKQQFSVIIIDTPQKYWQFPHLREVFSTADMVLAVVDQSNFSLYETSKYAPKLLSMGVSPEKIGIVLNKFDKSLASPKEVEKNFNAHFKEGIDPNKLPRILATIPLEWAEYVKKGYKGQAAGVDEALSNWHKIATVIADLAGYKYTHLSEGKKSSGSIAGNLLNFFNKLSFRKA